MIEIVLIIAVLMTANLSYPATKLLGRQRQGAVSD